MLLWKAYDETYDMLNVMLLGFHLLLFITPWCKAKHSCQDLNLVPLSDDRCVTHTPQEFRNSYTLPSGCRHRYCLTNESVFLQACSVYSDGEDQTGTTGQLYLVWQEEEAVQGQVLGQAQCR